MAPHGKKARGEGASKPPSKLDVPEDYKLGKKKRNRGLPKKNKKSGTANVIATEQKPATATMSSTAMKLPGTAHDSRLAAYNAADIKDFWGPRYNCTGPHNFNLNRRWETLTSPEEQLAAYDAQRAARAAQEAAKNPQVAAPPANWDSILQPVARVSQLGAPAASGKNVGELIIVSEPGSGETSAEVTQDAPIEVVMALPDVAELIIHYVSTSMTDVVKLNITSKKMRQFVLGAMRKWVLRSVDVHKVESMKDNELRSDEPSLRPLYVTADYKGKRLSYEKEFVNEMHVLRGISVVQPTIVTLVLRGMSFLDHELAIKIINTCSNLQDLFIIDCDLVHVGHLEKLIDAIDANPRKFTNEKGKEVKTYCKLDYAPRYYDGPDTPVPTDKIAAPGYGRYGITYNDPAVETTKAVAVLLIKSWPKAMDLGFDLMKPGSAFRIWLDKLPFPRRCVLYLYEALKTLHKKTRGTMKGGAAAKNAFWDDICAAVFGEDKLSLAFKEEWRTVKECEDCKKELSPLLFPYNRPFCWGCTLTQYFSVLEDDHHKKERRGVVDMWLKTVARIKKTEPAKLNDFINFLPSFGKNGAAFGHQAQKELWTLDDAAIDLALDMARHLDFQAQHELGFGSRPVGHVVSPSIANGSRFAVHTLVRHALTTFRGVDRKSDDVQLVHIGAARATSRFCPSYYQHYTRRRAGADADARNAELVAARTTNGHGRDVERRCRAYHQLHRGRWETFGRNHIGKTVAADWFHETLTEAQRRDEAEAQQWAAAVGRGGRQGCIW